MSLSISEDLDLQIDSGKVVGLPHVDNWKSDSPGQIRKRREYFEKLVVALSIPSCSTHINEGSLNRKARGATYNVEYPGRFTRDLVDPFRPFVLLEVGRARVHPWVKRQLSPFVHDHLEASGQLADYRSNRHESVRCLHPIVTLIEKIEAIARRFPSADPAGFIRHYEDAARIIEKESQLPRLQDGIGDLIDTLLKDRTIRRFPDADDPAFTLVDPELRKTLERAHAAIAPMFWGERLSLNHAAGTIRAWLARVG